MMSAETPKCLWQLGINIIVFQSTSMRGQVWLVLGWAEIPTGLSSEVAVA